MGACYSVDFTVKFLDRKGAENAMRDYIKKHDGVDCRFSIESEDNLKDLDSLIGVFLASHQHNFRKDDEDKDGFITYTSFFDASYGWHGVMWNMFDTICQFVADGSTLLIDDEGQTTYTKEGGAIV